MASVTGAKLFEPFEGIAACYQTVSTSCASKTIPMTETGFKVFIGEFSQGMAFFF